MAKRRSNGTGSLKKRDNGTWQISIMVGRKPNGKRNIKYFTGRTQAEARKKMKAYACHFSRYCSVVSLSWTTS